MAALPQMLLSRELPLGCVLRLWDTYLAYRTSHASEASLQQLHIYVCLAILEVCTRTIRRGLVDLPTATVWP